MGLPMHMISRALLFTDYGTYFHLIMQILAFTCQSIDKTQFFLFNSHKLRFSACIFHLLMYTINLQLFTLLYSYMNYKHVFI